MNDTAVSVEMLKTIVIDPDFESVCPPLTKEEFSLLEQNILSDGEVTTPLVVWNNILIDGHHRRQIILKHPEISFSIKEVDFDDRYVAEAWICKNQIVKRNLTPEQRTYILGKRYKAEKHTDGAADGFRGNQHEKLVVGKIYPLPEKQPISEKCPPPERPRTSERIAKESKVSEKAVRLAEKYSDGVDAAEAACPGIKGELLSGAIKPTRQLQRKRWKQLQKLQRKQWRWQDRHLLRLTRRRLLRRKPLRLLLKPLLPALKLLLRLLLPVAGLQ